MATVSTVASAFDFSMPTVAFASGANAMLGDSVFFFFTILSRRIPLRILSILRRSFAWTNALVWMVLMSVVVSRCRSKQLGFCAHPSLNHASCFQACAISTLFYLLCTWTDRCVLPLIGMPQSRADRWRACATLVVLWMFIGTRETLVPLLLLLVGARRCSLALPRVAPVATTLLRLLIASLCVLGLRNKCDSVSKVASAGGFLLAIVSS